MESSYLVFDLETVGLSLDAFDETQHEYLFRRAETEADRERVVNELSLSPVLRRDRMQVAFTGCDKVRADASLAPGHLVQSGA